MACVDCATGSLHAGTPSGKVTTIHDLPTYVAEPPAGTEAKAVVVIISDAFGWELPNNRILADNFAKKGGFEVFLPDFFDGELPLAITWKRERRISTVLGGDQDERKKKLAISQARNEPGRVLLIPLERQQS